MGVEFQITLYAGGEKAANAALEAAFERINQLNSIMSDYDSSSELSRLGQTAPSKEPVKLSKELFLVLAKAQSLSRRTGGAFDVTVGPLTKLWRRARRRKQMPEAGDLAAARAATGYRRLELDAKTRTARLLRPNMRLDLGGIAKGYAADEALAVLRRRGITRAVVNGSGDMAIGDPPPRKKGWEVGVNPRAPGGPPSEFLLLANCGVAASGDMYQFVEIDGRRYSHILDPRTGLGLTDRSSVTVVARDCMTADSLASAVSVLGPKDGLKLVKETPGAEARILRIEGDRQRSYATPGYCRLPRARPSGAAR